MDTTTFAAARDLTSSADAAREVLSAFDALAAGEAFVALLPARETRQALAALQSGRKGLFEWSVLAEGSAVRVEVLRRGASEGERRGVTEALAWDHDRLEAIEAAAFAAREAGDLAGAAQLLAPFVTGLKRHIRFEEEILFPTFEERLGFPPHAGPTAVMRFEHRQIEELLARMELEIGVAGNGAEATRARLHQVLGEHNVKEERILYPHTDQALGAEGADALVAEIQAS